MSLHLSRAPPSDPLLPLRLISLKSVFVLHLLVYPISLSTVLVYFYLDCSVRAQRKGLYPNVVRHHSPQRGFCRRHQTNSSYWYYSNLVKKFFEKVIESCDWKVC